MFFYLGELSHFPSCFGADVTNLNEPFERFAPSPLLRVWSWLRPFKGHCEQKAMRDEGVQLFMSLIIIFVLYAYSVLLELHCTVFLLVIHVYAWITRVETVKMAD